jgi:hypothetical protein
LKLAINLNEKKTTDFMLEIKDLTPVRGQDGKISDTQGKDFWSPVSMFVSFEQKIECSPLLVTNVKKEITSL